MVEYKNINLTLNNKVIFSNFNLKIEKNEKVIFTAPSGRGKSLLLKMILGFIKPDSGEIWIDNKELSKHTIQEIRNKTAYISQGVELRKIMVNEFFKDIFSLKNNRYHLMESLKIKEILSEFNLEEEILYKNIKDLSGGEKQRVALTALLLLDKDILILDEITSALEKELKKKVVDYILKLEKTILAISHDEEWQENIEKTRIVSW